MCHILKVPFKCDLNFSCVEQGFYSRFNMILIFIVVEPADSTVAPHDKQLTMSSLYGLEQIAGIGVVTSLARIHDDVMSTAGITLNKSQQKKLKECETNTGRLEIIISQWESGSSDIPPTWGSLLSILKKLNLNDLRQQVMDVIGE